MQPFGSITYRIEINNAEDEIRCLERKRYNGYLRDGNLSETEKPCSNTGAQFVFKVRANIWSTSLTLSYSRFLKKGRAIHKTIIYAIAALHKGKRD